MKTFKDKVYDILGGRALLENSVTIKANLGSRRTNHKEITNMIGDFIEEQGDQYDVVYGQVDRGMANITFETDAPYSTKDKKDLQDIWDTHIKGY